MAHGSRSRGSRLGKPSRHFLGDHSVKMWTVLGGMAAVVSIPTAILIAYWTLNTQNATSVSPGLSPTLTPRTAGVPTESPKPLHSHKVNTYSLILSENEYSPLRAARPTNIQIQEATARGVGDIQWREVDFYDQFNSGTGEYMTQLPSRITTPTFAACNYYTIQDPSVHAAPGTAFCMTEPGNIMAGVSVESISGGKADLRVTIWKYFN
jgi:hypothetical protein